MAARLSSAQLLLAAFILFVGAPAAEAACSGTEPVKRRRRIASSSRRFIFAANPILHNARKSGPRRPKSVARRASSPVHSCTVSATVATLQPRTPMQSVARAPYHRLASRGRRKSVARRAEGTNSTAHAALQARRTLMIRVIAKAPHNRIARQCVAKATNRASTTRAKIQSAHAGQKQYARDAPQPQLPRCATAWRTHASCFKTKVCFRSPLLASALASHWWWLAASLWSCGAIVHSVAQWHLCPKTSDLQPISRTSSDPIRALDR